jgi:hypothetical protein
VEIAEESTCLMMTQSAAETPVVTPAAEAAELTAEPIADAAEDASEAATDAAEDATEAADDALEPQAASTAQHPPTAIMVSARRRALARGNGVGEGLVTLNNSIS